MADALDVLRAQQNRNIVRQNSGMYRRPAEEQELDELFAMHREAYQTHVEALWGSWDESWQRENFLRECAESCCEAIVVDDVLAGYVQWVEAEQTLSIWNLILVPRFRGRGFGSEIVRQLQERAALARSRVSLHVFKTNPRALSFYVDLGFSEIARSERGIQLVWEPSA